ncbi:MAG: hypothetical protein ABI266_10275 [Ginsengibacter sp.]
MKIFKQLFLFLFTFLLANSGHAQIQNTSWKGVFNLPSPADCIFEFKTDTALLTMDGNILETSKLTVKGDTLTLQKLSGGSPCDADVIGIYRFKINGDKLTLTVIDDACNERAMAGPEEPLTAVKN